MCFSSLLSNSFPHGKADMLETTPFRLTYKWLDGEKNTEVEVDFFNAHNIILYFKHLSKIIQILIVLVFNIFDLVLQSVLRIESNDLKDETTLR